MESWTVEEVCQFLKRNDFEENVIRAFRVNKVRGRVLPLLNDEDLKQLELAALGDRKYLQHLLSRVRREDEVRRAAGGKTHADQCSLSGPTHWQ